MVRAVVLLLLCIPLVAMAVVPAARADDCHSPDDSNALEKLIARDVATYSKLAQMPVHALVCSGGGTEGGKLGEIRVDTSELADIKAEVKETAFDPIVKLIIAHEFGHQIQLNKYGADKFSQRTSDMELNSEYEAQADLLAGEYIASTADVGSEKANNEIEDALQTMFDIGANFEDHVDLGYPSHEQRRMAVRTGLALGTIVSMAIAVRNGGDPRLVDSVGVLSSKIDLEPGDNYLDYSFREAEKIVHAKADLVSQIDATANAIDWDTNPDHPYVHYDISYQNNSTSTLKLDLDVQCISVLRANKHDTRHSKLIDSNRFRFDLAPNASHTITGSLRWSGDTTYMPIIMYPPDKETSLISVHSN